MCPLDLLHNGETAEIADFEMQSGQSRRSRCCHNGHIHRAGELGLRKGKVVQVLNNKRGPLLLKIGHSRVAIGRGLAKKILVHKTAV